MESRGLLPVKGIEQRRVDVSPLEGRAAFVDVRQQVRRTPTKLLLRAMGKAAKAE
jgi:hypothetical protein